MLSTLLKSKIHRATITGACLQYEGSITIPPRLMELAGLREFEKVLVANIASGARFETYVIPGNDGTNILLNGAAAHLGKPGDKVIIMAWAQVDEQEANGFRPRVVLVDDKNAPRDGK